MPKNNIIVILTIMGRYFETSNLPEPRKQEGSESGIKKCINKGQKFDVG